MSRTQERCLICFIVCMAFGAVQLHFVISGRSGRPDPSPCHTRVGIHWVRDAHNCSVYFICVALRPLRMPPCPMGYVWSVRGRNCVPENSMWDDCDLDPLHPDHLPRPSPRLRRPLLPTAHSARQGGQENWTASFDNMAALIDPMHPDEERRKILLSRLPNHPCTLNDQETYLPHPDRCHWFYNCSAPVTERSTTHPDGQGWDLLTEECPYPKLFSLDTRTCQPYTRVDCGNRGLFLDPCDYRHPRCGTAHCPPCTVRHGNCAGLSDGLHPFRHREWTPRHVVCLDQRVLQQPDCPAHTPIFSPVTRRCEHLLDIPTAHGGSQPSCQGRGDGRYPDATGRRCDIFYHCSQQAVQGRFQCPSGAVFDPERRSCRRQNARGVPPPCGGQNLTEEQVGPSVDQVLCQGMEDGVYADPYGRCPMYYRCNQSLLTSFYTCDRGTFDPRSRRCEVSVSHVPAPCGPQPNPCMDKPDGQYADLVSHCQGSYQCKRGVVVRHRSCHVGTVFNEVNGSCEMPDDTAPPCGMAPSCVGRQDGRYPASLRGCQFFFTCHNEDFRGYSRCSIDQGGFYFNSLTSQCDFPQNICAPCGVRTENWWVA